MKLTREEILRSIYIISRIRNLRKKFVTTCVSTIKHTRKCSFFARFYRKKWKACVRAPKFVAHANVIPVANTVTTRHTTTTSKTINLNLALDQPFYYRKVGIDWFRKSTNILLGLILPSQAIGKK